MSAVAHDYESILFSLVKILYFQISVVLRSLHQADFGAHSHL